MAKMLRSSAEYLSRKPGWLKTHLPSGLGNPIDSFDINEAVVTIRIVSLSTQQ